MEIAKLILEYISVLIWPVMIMSILLVFRKHLATLFNRILEKGEKIDLKVGGQEISVTLAKAAVKEAINTAIEKGAKTEDPQIETIAVETAEVLSVLPELHQDDITFLADLSSSNSDFHTISNCSRASIDRLTSLKLVDTVSGQPVISQLGIRVKHLTENRDLGELVHKIGQAL